MPAPDAAAVARNFYRWVTRSGSNTTRSLFPGVRTLICSDGGIRTRAVRTSNHRTQPIRRQRQPMGGVNETAGYYPAPPCPCGMHIDKQLVPSRRAQARACCEPARGCTAAGRTPGRHSSRAEQGQFVSGSKRRRTSRREPEQRRAHGLRDRILQDQLLTKSGRTISTEMVRAFQGADLTRTDLATGTVGCQRSRFPGCLR